MQFKRWLIGTLSLGTVLSLATVTQAQSSLRYIGQAVGGQRVSVDLNSITSASFRSVNFVYYLGNDRRPSQADCVDRTWTTFEDGVVRSPQSATTANMLELVCSGGASTQPSQSVGSQSWFVFAPPSNVRVSPNGSVLCVLRSPVSIRVSGFSGQWAITDVCGSRGYIHNSQIEPIN